LVVLYRNLSQPLNLLGDSAGQRAALREADRLEAKLEKVGDAKKPVFTDDEKVLGCLASMDFGGIVKREAEVDRMLKEAEQQARDHPEVPYYQSRLATAKVLKAVRLLALRSLGPASAEFQGALALLKKLAADHPGEPKLRLGVADVASRCGTCYLLCGNVAESEKHFQAAFADLEKLGNDHPQVPRFRYLHSQMLIRVVLLKVALRDFRSAADHTSKALALLQRLATDFPGCSEYRRHLAQGRITQANYLMSAGAPAEAEAAYREGVRLWTKTAADFPTITEFRLGLGNGHMQLGNHLVQVGKTAEAAESYHEGTRIHEAVAKELPGRGDCVDFVAADHFRLGQFLVSQKRHAEAMVYYSKSVACLEKALEMCPHRRDWAGNLQNVLKQRGLAAQELNDWSAYERDLQRAGEVGERAAPAFVRLAAARRHVEGGDLVRARADADDLFLDEGLSGEERYELAGLCARLSELAGSAERKEKDAAQAVAALGQALEAGHAGPLPWAEAPQFRALRVRADFKKLGAAEARETGKH
jgi:tetratricopeptide (TPR) repeat protein